MMRWMLRVEDIPQKKPEVWPLHWSPSLYVVCVKNHYRCAYLYCIPIKCLLLTKEEKILGLIGHKQYAFICVFCDVDDYMNVSGKKNLKHHWSPSLWVVRVKNYPQAGGRVQTGMA